MLATFGELTIATQFAVIHSLIHVVGFFAREMREIERDLIVHFNSGMSTWK